MGSKPNAPLTGPTSRNFGRLRMHLVTERNRKWWVVVAMALTTLLMTIEFHGLTVARPTIGRDLDTSTTGLQWTINAYLLALAAPSVTAGRLADIFGLLPSPLREGCKRSPKPRPVPHREYCR